MKTRTVVELSGNEIVDALIAVAKKSIQPTAGSVKVELHDKAGQKLEDGYTANVVFEWGAKVKADA